MRRTVEGLWPCLWFPVFFTNFKLKEFYFQSIIPYYADFWISLYFPCTHAKWTKKKVSGEGFEDAEGYLAQEVTLGNKHGRCPPLSPHLAVYN